MEYEDIRGANRAIRELNNTPLGGRPIFVREDREQQNPRQRRGGGGRGDQANGGGRGGGGGADFAGRQLYVGNLSFETTWADLKDHFRTAGEVERADVTVDGSRRSKGWGTVRFSTPVRGLAVGWRRLSFVVHTCVRLGVLSCAFLFFFFFLLQHAFAGSPPASCLPSLLLFRSSSLTCSVFVCVFCLMSHLISSYGFLFRRFPPPVPSF